MGLSRENSVFLVSHEKQSPSELTYVECSWNLLGRRKNETASVSPKQEPVRVELHVLGVTLCPAVCSPLFPYCFVGLRAHSPAISLSASLSGLLSLITSSQQNHWNCKGVGVGLLFLSLFLIPGRYLTCVSVILNMNNVFWSYLLSFLFSVHPLLTHSGNFFLKGFHPSIQPSILFFI